MAKPSWCTKPSPCDYDKGSAYCPHRECRQRLEKLMDECNTECMRLAGVSIEQESVLAAARKECEQRLWGGADEIVRLVAANILNVLNGTVHDRVVERRETIDPRVQAVRDAAEQKRRNLVGE